VATDAKFSPIIPEPEAHARNVVRSGARLLELGIRDNRMRVQSPFTMPWHL
jgi:hypothetical protein